MNKKFIALAILMVILGFIIGTMFYNYNNNKNVGIAKDNFSLVTDDCINEVNIGNIKQASNEEEKISPNATIAFKILYTNCGHIIEKKMQIDNNLVNKNKEEIEKIYKDWKIEKFTKDEVVLFKEENDICNEHYLLKNENEYVKVYKIGEHNEEVLIEDTNIAVKYLEKEDVDALNKGVAIYTREELNKSLEDFGHK